MTAVLLGIVVAGSVFGDLLKAHAMRRQGEPPSLGGNALARFAATAMRNTWFLLSLLAYAVSFFGFMALLSVEDVSFAVPATALSFALETLLARFALRESVSPRRWAGAALVTAGVWMIV